MANFFRGTVAALTLAVASSIVLPAAAQAPKGDDAKMEQAIRKFIEEHPEVLLDSINRYIAKQQEDIKIAGDKVILDAEKDLVGTDGQYPVLGNPKGSVTIVYVLDAACGYCRRMTKDLASLVATNPDVRVIQHWVPFLSSASEYAARVAHLVSKRYQPKFGDWYKSLMSQTGPLTNEMVDRVTANVIGAETVDVIRSDVMTGAESADLAAAIKANFDLAGRTGIKGTPFLWVVGARQDGMFRGATPADQLQVAIDKAKLATQ